MAPTLLAQLITAVHNQDAAMFNALVKIMATACDSTETDVIRQLLYNNHFYQPDNHLYNPVARILVETGRVADYCQVIWLDLEPRHRWELCWDQGSFMTKVVAHHQQSPNSPLTSRDQLSLYICHRLLCTEPPSQVTVSALDQRLVNLILSDEPYRSSEVTSNLTMLLDLAMVVGAKDFLASSGFLIAGRSQDIPQRYYDYVVKNNLLELNTIGFLIGNYDFVSNYFSALFNYSTSAPWPTETTERLLLLALAKLTKPARNIFELRIQAVTRYSNYCQRIIFLLVRCGEAVLVGDTVNLTSDQIDQIWSYACYHISEPQQYLRDMAAIYQRDYLTDHLTVPYELQANFAVRLEPLAVCTQIFSHVNWSRQFYDHISSELVTTQARVGLFTALFLSNQPERSATIQFNRSDLAVVSAALRDNSGHIMWLELFQPTRWSLEALAQLYHISLNKSYFLAYAVTSHNKVILAEVLRDCQTNLDLQYRDLTLIYDSVTDLAMLQAAGAVVEYLSSLEQTIGKPWRTPQTYLLPELVSYYRA